MRHSVPSFVNVTTTQCDSARWHCKFGRTLTSSVPKVGSCPAVWRRLKADRAAATEPRRTATYRGELRSCFTGWLPLFKIIPFARSWDYICLSDQASGNHLEQMLDRARSRSRGSRCESRLSPHSRPAVVYLSPSRSPAGLNTRGKSAYRIRICAAIAGFSPWQCKRNRGANCSTFSFLSFFRVFFFCPYKKAPALRTLACRERVCQVINQSAWCRSRLFYHKIDSLYLIALVDV